MEGSFYEKLFSELHGKGIRYALCGGLAVNLHGIPRATADADLIVDFSEENIGKLIEVMETLEMQPAVPVDPQDLSRARKREEWRAEKGSVVFQFVNRSRPFLKVDVFLDHPLPFEEIWSGRRRLFYRNVEVSVVSLEHLIALKEKVLPPRQQDLADLESLRKVKALLDRRKGK